MKDVQMKQTAKKLVELLNNYHVFSSSDFVIRTVKQTLRGSWYVGKLVELGYKKCIYINMEGYGFMVVLDDCTIASGENIMILTAFESMAYELSSSPDICWWETICDNRNWKLYSEDEGSEDGLIICQNLRALNDYITNLLDH